MKECELLDIAEHLEPDILLRLAIKLSFSVAEYLRMKESHTSELAFIILYKWRENRVKGQQNRKELVGVLFDLKKVRLAEMVASKDYGLHQLSWSSCEMESATNYNYNTTNLDIAVKGASIMQTAGIYVYRGNTTLIIISGFSSLLLELNPSKENCHDVWQLNIKFIKILLNSLQNWVGSHDRWKLLSYRKTKVFVLMYTYYKLG